MINTMEMFSGLGNVKIEGIDLIAVKYKNICDQAKKKNYDILDHRKAEVTIQLVYLCKKGLTFLKKTEDTGEIVHLGCLTYIISVVTYNILE